MLETLKSHVPLALRKMPGCMAPCPSPTTRETAICHVVLAFDWLQGYAGDA
jgi:hypothetical protein